MQTSVGVAAPGARDAEVELRRELNKMPADLNAILSNLRRLKNRDQAAFSRIANEIPAFYNRQIRNERISKFSREDFQIFLVRMATEISVEDAVEVGFRTLANSPEKERLIYLGHLAVRAGRIRGLTSAMDRDASSLLAGGSEKERAFLELYCLAWKLRAEPSNCIRKIQSIDPRRELEWSKISFAEARLSAGDTKSARAEIARLGPVTCDSKFAKNNESLLIVIATLFRLEGEGTKSIECLKKLNPARESELTSFRKHFELSKAYRLTDASSSTGELSLARASLSEATLKTPLFTALFLLEQVKNAVLEKKMDEYGTLKVQLNNAIQNTDFEMVRRFGSVIDGYVSRRSSSFLKNPADLEELDFSLAIGKRTR